MVALVVLALLAGCGGGSEADTAESPLDPWRPIVVTLDGLYSAENVGLVMALKQGYFEDANLGVELRNPIFPRRAIQYVTERAVDLAISHQPQVVLAKENGLDIVAAGSVVPEPTAAMIWLEKSKIGGLADLKGKTIGVYGLSFERGILESVLARAGLTLDDVKVKKVEHETVPDLVSGRIDATFGNSWNVEGAELEARGLEPVITRVQDLGIPSYDELVVVARSERLRKDPQLIPDFLSAVARGTEAAIEDPEAAVKAIVEEKENREEKPNKKGIEAAVEATLPLLSRDGYMDPDQAAGLIDWMHEEGIIERPLPVSELLTNEYVDEED